MLALKATKRLVESFNDIEAFFNEVGFKSGVRGAVRVRTVFWRVSHNGKARYKF